MTVGLQRCKMGALAVLFVGSLLAPVLTQALAHADAQCTVSATLVNSCRPWLGAAAFNYDAAQSNVQAQITYHEQRIGHPVDVMHSYHTPGQNTLNATDIYYATRPGTILYANWKPATAWGTIATQNAAIDSMANSIKTLGSTKIFLTLFHEPEDDVSPGGDSSNPACAGLTYKGNAGSVADYRNMWHYVHDRFAADGVTNVVWVMNYMSFVNWDCMVPDLYPGDQYVDWITFDPYGSNLTPTFASTAGRFYDLLMNTSSTAPDPLTGLTHNFASKPFGLAEWGATNSTTQEMQYYDDAKAALDGGPNGHYGNLKMYLIFDERSGQSPTGTNRRVGYNDDGSVSVAGTGGKADHYKAFATDPMITGTWQFADGIAPTVPTGLAATATGANSANLHWTASTDSVGVTGYDIFRNGSSTPIAVVTNGTSYTDTGLSDATAYTYTVSAFDAAGNTSAQSDPASVTTPDVTAPSVPGGVVAIAVSPTEIDLTWDPATDTVGVTGYRLYRDGVALPDLGTVTTYKDLDLSAETAYTYKVAAFDAAGNVGSQSAAVTTTTPGIPVPPDTTAPSVPGGLTATATADGAKVELSWQGSTDQTGVTGYTIYQAGHAIATVPGDVTTYADATVADATAYTYTVSAFDAAGNTSAQSDPASVTTPDVTAPSLPDGLTATVSSDGQSAQIDWQASTDKLPGVRYHVYRNGAQVATVSATTYTDTGLADGQTYSYTVDAFDAAGNTTVQTAAVIVNTSDVIAPGAPTALAANVHGSEIDLTWQAPTDNVGVVGYKLYRDGALIATVTADTAFADTHVSDATTYRYTVAAYDAAGNLSAQSDPASVTIPDSTAPGVPTGLQATATSGSSLDITWQAPHDNVAVSGYHVHIYQDGVQIATATTNGTSYTATGLTDATTYQYTVVAFDAAGNTSAQSDFASATTPDVTAPTPPSSLAATATDGSHVSLSWQPGSDKVGIVGYHVYRDGTLIGTVTATTYIDAGLAGATSYTYTVSAFDAAGNESAVSNASIASTPDVTAPTVPTGLAATLVSTSQITLAWQPSGDNVGIAGYDIYRGGTLIGTSSTTSYIDNSVQEATTYTYTVAAYDAAGNVSPQSAVATAVIPDATAPTVPQGLAATAVSGTQINLSWTAASDIVGVTGYRVYRDGVLIGTTTSATSFTDTGLTNATTYSYTIAAYDAAGNASAQSVAMSVTTPDVTPPTAPTNLQANLNLLGLSAQLTWQPASDNVAVTGYRVYLAGLRIATVTGTSYTATGLTSATAYLYTVTAVDAAGNESAASLPALLTVPDVTPPSTPANVNAVAQTNGTSVLVSWTASSDNVAVTGYRVYRGATYTLVTGTSYLDTGLTSGATYSYTVYAVDAAGNLSAVSNTATVTTVDVIAPTAPTLTATAFSSSQINLSWQGSTDNVGVASYRVYRGGVLITTVSGTTYSNTGLSPSTSYAYYIVAVDAAGNLSSQSASVNATTLAALDTTPPSQPTGLVATATGSSQINLTWTAATDNVAVTGYRVYRNNVQITAVTGTTYADTGLSPSTVYGYYVIAIDAAGNASAQSTGSSTATPPDATPPSKPTLFKVASVTTTSETLTWAAATDNVAVTGYRIYRANTLIATVSGTTYTDTGLAPHTSYTYHINAIDAAGNASAQATAPTLPTASDTTPPTTPTGVTATTGTVSKTVDLHWNACTDDVAVTGYRIYRGSALVTTVSGTTLTYTDSGRVSGTTYSYHIVAIDAAGNASADSITVSAKAK